MASIVTMENGVPPHVPAGLVFDYDFYSGPEVTRDPVNSMPRLLDRPDIFFTPRNGGHWVVTRQKKAVDLLQEPEIFSSNPMQSDPARARSVMPRIPLDIDPPAHAGYRKILNAMFSPRAVRDMEAGVRDKARELIDNVHARGECDFVAEVARRYPTEIFLRLLGLPVSQRPQFVEWVGEMVRATDPADARAAYVRVAALMREALDARRDRPQNDLLSQLLLADYQGRDLTHDELVGIGVLLFVGGLDTVVAMISFIMLHLATHPDHRRLLIANPGRIPNALEEIIRRFSISSIFRYVAKDAAFADVDFRKGDRVLIVNQIYGLDDREVECPMKVDLDRRISRHTAFGAGPHRCLGSHLARLELRVMVEEWLARIPDFEIETAGLEYHGGAITEPLSLPMRWEVSKGQHADVG